MKREILLLLAVIFCFVYSADRISTKAEPKLWAILVAGSYTYDNYRHQADVCHAYHILSRHGIPDERIVVMMYDDIAYNKMNPTPGVIVNHPFGEDVYNGVPKDYTGKLVTPKNFLKVLQGNAPSGGSGKVINSTSEDHLFINLVDHGATGLFAFPNGMVMRKNTEVVDGWGCKGVVSVLTAKKFLLALQDLYEQKRYAKLVVYMESCESGSMFRHKLPKDINVYVTTAANYNESSYACYLDNLRNTYLGDLYSVSWMEDSDSENLERESLFKQFEIVKKETNMSHVQEYGDLTISKLGVGAFQGNKEAAPTRSLPKVPFDAVPSLEVPVRILLKKLGQSTNETEILLLQEKLRQILSNREMLKKLFESLTETVAETPEVSKRIKEIRNPLIDLDCHDSVVTVFHENCLNLGQNPYAMKFIYMLVNMCEEKIAPQKIEASILSLCKTLPATVTFV